MIDLKIDPKTAPGADIPSRPSIALREIFKTWWPLAASWLLMGTELPAVSAVIARLPEPEINLAAYGSVVFAIALIIEAPIIMMLAASTALSKNRQAYRILFRFMMVSGAVLTAIHVLIAFTPLFEVVVVRLMGVPEPVIAPARIGLRIMIPWTWSIAYRRFNQGVLIRFGHSGVVGQGTFLRLSVNFLVLLSGFASENVPGIVVGPAAVIAGVLTEAAYIGWRVRPVIERELPGEDTDIPALTLRKILAFYLPLALTSLIFLLVQPLVSAALSRMPDALRSLAVWPVIGGLTFMIRSLGVAYNEVVVSLLDRPGASPGLARFAHRLLAGSTLIMLVLILTPLSGFWFGTISGLSPNLVSLAESAFWVVTLWPALNVLQSFYQGVIMHSGQTRAITESVIAFLGVAGLVLLIGVLWVPWPGLYVGLAASVTGSFAQAFWLRRRSRRWVQQVFARDGVQKILI